MVRKQTPIQARKAALESDYAPLYAIAGLTDALAEILRNALNDTEERGRKRVEEIQSRAPELQRQVTGSAEELRTFVITLPDQVRNLPDVTRARLAELQLQANDLLAQATTTYGELAGRGKRVVDGAVGTARNVAADAEERVDDVRDDLAEQVDPALAKVQEGVIRARRRTTGRTATETVTPRSAAKAAATRKAATAETAAKKAAAKKAAAKKTAAVKTAPAKKAAPAKKVATKKAAATKTTATKTPAKKAAAKKAATPVVAAETVVVETPSAPVTDTPES